MKTLTIMLASLINFGLFALTQGQTPSGPARSRLIIPSDQFSNVQRLLDEQTALGYAVSGVSYHSSIKNLHTNGRLEIDLEKPVKATSHQYQALTSELEAPALQKMLNDYGAKGFRLLAQTPIPLELGFVRSRDMFLAVMERTEVSSVLYEYRVLAYRHKNWIQQEIRQASTDGFTEACKRQFGPVIYLVMEKTTTSSP